MLHAMILLTCLIHLGRRRASPAVDAGSSQGAFLPQPDDPPWLVQVWQFHGHLGPSVVAGTRFGLAGLATSGHAASSTSKSLAKAHLSTAAVVLPRRRSSLAPGRRSANGRSIGCRPMRFGAGEETRTGKTAELCPTPQLLELLGSLKRAAKKTATAQEDHEHSPCPIPSRIAGPKDCSDERRGIGRGTNEGRTLNTDLC